MTRRDAWVPAAFTTRYCVSQLTLDLCPVSIFLIQYIVECTDRLVRHSLQEVKLALKVLMADECLLAQFQELDCISCHFITWLHRKECIELVKERCCRTRSKCEVTHFLLRTIVQVAVCIRNSDVSNICLTEQLDDSILRTQIWEQRTLWSSQVEVVTHPVLHTNTAVFKE